MLVILFCLNITYVGFFILWYIADSKAIGAAEATSGFTEAAMLPNSHLMWIAAYASLILMIALDACAIAQWRNGSTDHTETAP